jgi:6-phosphogluconolactonase (cycloisomerase 2 family)
MVGAVVGPNSDWLIGAPAGGPDTQLITYPIATDRTLGTTARSLVLGAGVIESLSLNAAGSRLYAQAATGRVGQHILQYQVDANGALTPLSPSSVASVGNDHMVLTRDGRCLFSPVIQKSTTRPEPGAIATFRIQDDGALTPSTPAVQDVLRSLSAIAVTPDSRYLITVHASDNRLYVYRISTSCSLSLVGDFHHTGGMTPYAMVIR